MGASSMQALRIVQKSELVNKFGIGYVTDIDHDSPCGFVVCEVIGGSRFSVFDEDDSFKTASEAFEDRWRKTVSDANERILNHEETMKRFANKWFMFKYRNGLVSAVTKKKVDKILDKIDNLRKINNNKVSLDTIYKTIPDSLLIANTIIEPDVTYYLYEKSYSFHVDFKITPVRLKSADVSIERGETVLIGFTVGDGHEESNHYISHMDVMSFNGDYFKTGHSEHFVFIDKEKCVNYAVKVMEAEREKLAAKITEFKAL